MNPFRPCPLKIAMAIVLFLIVQSCTLVPGTWKNERISSGKRDDFHQLNAAVLKNLAANDVAGLKALSSKDMAAGKTDSLVKQISKQLKENSYHLLDEYYAVHKYADTDTLVATGPGINRYGLKYPYVTTEMYFAFYLPPKSDNELMLSLVYGKYKSGWKIVKLELAPYTINGKTAPELYAMAREQFGKNYYQAALSNTRLAIACMKPGAYWQYPNEADVAWYFLKVRQQADFWYRYPFILNQVSSGPMILEVSAKTSSKGTFPDIWYMTHYDLKDTAAVKKENEQIRQALSKTMPGLGENNKYIFYTAFNQKPAKTYMPPHFDMTEKLH